MTPTRTDVLLFAIFCAFFAIIILLSNANGQSPTPFDINKVDVSKISADEMAKTIAHRNELFGEQQQVNVQTDEEIKTQAQTLVAAAQTSDQSAKALAAYQASVATIVTNANKAITDLAALVKKHHLDLIILVGLWLCLCGAVYLKAGMALGPIGIYAAIGIAAAGTGFILWRL